MDAFSSWFSPFWKQAFVAAGASLNVAQLGIVMGYVSGTIPQLKQPDSEIPINDEEGSWLASVQGITNMFGSIAVASIMGIYGRRFAGALCSSFALFGWLCIVFGSNFTWLITGRILQGISMGLASASGTIMVGECSSPRNRGVFLMLLSAVMSGGSLLVQVLTFYFYWRICAIVCAIISFIGLLIYIKSPESPSWLAEQGRYEDCKKSYRWLRGCDEEDELNVLIEVGKQLIESKVHINKEPIIKMAKRKLSAMLTMLKKKEVYKPIIIVTHLASLSYWCGLCVMSSYPGELVVAIAGKDVNVPLVVVIMGVVRFTSNTFAMCIIKQFRRKVYLLVSLGFMIVVILVITIYTYAKYNNMLAYDHPLIGIILVLVHMFSIAVGSLPMAFTIAGEINPLKYRSIAGSLSTTMAAVHVFLSIKSFTFFMRKINIYGTYLIIAVISAYCLPVCYFLLPETKDRTLHDIEEEFKGRPRRTNEKSGEPFLIEKPDNVEAH